MDRAGAADTGGDGVRLVDEGKARGPDSRSVGGDLLYCLSVDLETISEVRGTVGRSVQASVSAHPVAGPPTVQRTTSTIYFVVQRYVVVQN